MQESTSKYETKSSSAFLWVSLLLCAVLCCFHCWLYWPGFILDDAQTTLVLDKAGWHPAIMAYLLEIAYSFFGIHVYNLFLLSMIPFYTGIWLIIYSAYLKTKSWFSLLLIFPCFIGNITYTVIKLGSVSFSVSWICLLYALTLYAVVNPPAKDTKKIFYGFYGVVFMIALLGRQNAVLQIWPITFVWIGQYLATKNLSFWKYASHFILWAFLSGIASGLLLIGGTKAISKSDKGDVYPATLIVMHQIVGMCAPEMDESCFDPDWWYGYWAHDPHLMENLKLQYEEYYDDAEIFSLSYDPEVAFKYFTDLKGRYSKWWYAFTKYPGNFFKHVGFFYSELWTMSPDLFLPEELLEEFTPKRMIKHASIWHPLSTREQERIKKIAYQIPTDELRLTWGDKEYKADNFVRTYFPAFHAYVFIGICVILMIVGICLFIRTRTNLLYLLLISTSWGGFLSSLIIPLFAPRIFSRYMEPVYFCAVFSLQIFVLILMLNKQSIIMYVKNRFCSLKKVRENK